MKKLTLLLLALIFTYTGVFSQKSDSLLSRKTVFNNIFYYKGKIFKDTATYEITVKETALRKKGFNKKVDLAMVNGQNIVSLDSVPSNTPFAVNNVLITDRSFLNYIPHHEIVHVRKASHDGFVFPKSKDLKNDEIIVRGVYQTTPKVIVYQGHVSIPKDFFLINEKTFEAQRYRCSVANPLWDYVTNPSSIKSSKPVYVVDGRIQIEGFDCGDIPEKDIKTIEVFDAEDGRRYFGQKASNGIVAIATKNFTGELLPTLRNIRIVGETEYEMGRWKKTSDTTVEEINSYWNYRKRIFAQNGPVYMIGGKEETYESNRKNTEMDNIIGVEIKQSYKNITPKEHELKIDSASMVLSYISTTKIKEFGQDTIFIKTGSKPNFVSLNTQIDFVFYNLQKMRNGGKMLMGSSSKIPIYIVDNQEITADKLREYKPKELEFVESLEGCDAISKYGKRAEFGVVIYRKKKIE